MRARTRARIDRLNDDYSCGFTLVEVLVVVVILGIVSALSIVALAGALDRAKQRATMADMRTIGRTIEAYVVDNNFLPDDTGGLAALVPVLVPYQSDVLPISDHWGRELGYVASPTGDYTIESFGRDGVPGADIDASSRFEFDRDIVLANGRFSASPD